MCIPDCPHIFSIIAFFFAFLLITTTGVVFDNIIQLPGVLHSAKVTSCTAQKLQTISPLDRASCALACGLAPLCHAFLHSEPDQCELLSSPWSSTPTEEGQTLMRRRLEKSTKMTWRFKGSQYIVTMEKGNFTQTKTACAARGMHLWYPSSQEEIRFVEKDILCNLDNDLQLVPTWDSNAIIFKILFGVIDRPNGNCLLSDGVTKCSVDNYFDSQPNKESQECTAYWWREERFGWDDINCAPFFNASGLCEIEA